MKKIRMMMVSGYLIISTGLAFSYTNLTSEQDGIGEISVFEEKCAENDRLEEKDELQLLSVITQKPTIILSPTTMPTVAVVVQKTITPLAQISAYPVSDWTVSPTMVPSANNNTIPAITPSLSIDITNEENITDEIIEYNGKKISYFNTAYRIDEEVLEQLVSMIRKEPYVSSFVLFDINSEAMICYNENKYYPVASTVKAPFIMTCLKQIEEGEYSLEDTMEYVEKYKVSGDGTIKNEEFGTLHSIKDLIEHAILISDDIGYLMLQDHFGYKDYNDFLKEQGNRVTIGGGVKWGQTSAMDSLRNWKEIYSYINCESDNSLFFSNLLERTNKSFIRNALGDEYEVYNKMGWVRNQCCHDHAIVMDEQPYLLMIMTMGDVGKENQEFMEAMAEILNDVHEEMVKETEEVYIEGNYPGKVA